VQFIKRFFITNSVMTYHPREIMTTALFLANKTENLHYSLKEFSEKLSEIPGLDKITADEIVAPEFILTQGLRFCFDVRHPHRALKGLYLELQSLLRAAAAGEPSPPDAWRGAEGGAEGAAAAAAAARILREHGTPAQLSARVEAAQRGARELLQRPAMLSDAYFLFTPAQVALAALRAADAALVEALLGVKFALRPPPVGGEPAAGDGDAKQRRRPPPPGLARVLDEVDRCARVLRAAEFDDAQLKRDAVRVDRKLHFCRNPEKLDLVGLNRARKRDAGEDGKAEDKLAKKRRLEKERREREGDDLFGPSLAAKSEG
jgi:cyclin H